MILFPAFAALVWFAALRWRRTVRGFAAVAAGLAIILMVAYFHQRLGDWVEFEIFRPEFQLVLRSYAGILTAVGLYICVLPRRPADDSTARVPCAKCGYELEGLAVEHPGELGRCPECGTTNRLVPRSLRTAQQRKWSEARRRLRSDLAAADVSAARPAQQHPDTQDQPRGKQRDPEPDGAQPVL